MPRLDARVWRATAAAGHIATRGKRQTSGRFQPSKLATEIRRPAAIGDNPAGQAIGTCSQTTVARARSVQRGFCRESGGAHSCDPDVCV